MIICDFCSSKDVTRRYKCRSFKMLETPSYTHWSDGDWAACAVCADLIDNNKLPELTQRSLDAFELLPLFTEEEKAEYKAMLTRTHQTFDKERIKP